MKYDILIDRVAVNVRTSIIRGAGLDGHLTLAAIDVMHTHKMDGRASIDFIADKCYEIIINWDVRMIGKLRDIFPVYFPRSLRKGNLICGYNSDGDWEVLPR